VRSHSRILRYVARETLFSFFVAFLFFFFLFFVNQILLLAEQIISKRVPVWDVVRLIVYSLPQFMLLSFPFGTLVGTLMAVGRLSSDNELLAFQSLGVPSSRLLIPLVLLGCLFTATSFLVYDYLLPMGNIQFSALIRRLIYTNPAVELEPWSVKKFENTVIVTGDVEGNTLRNVLIIDRSADDDRRVITASKAGLREGEQRDVISLELDDVFTQQGYAKEEGNRYDYTTAKSMVYNILLKNIAATVSLGALGPSQQSSRDVWKEIVKKQAQQDKRRAERDAQVRSMLFGLSQELRASRGALSRASSQLEIKRRGLESLQRDLGVRRGADLSDSSLKNYLIEFHKKFSIPVACLVFALFAFPVGRVARRSGRTMGFGIGLFVAIFYWGLLYAGNNLGVRMGFSPALSMWLPDIIVFLGGSAFFLVGRKR
jgi:lipopolysaccharide export system permease protein